MKFRAALTVLIATTILSLPSTRAAEAPKAVKLNNDAKYQEALEKVLKSAPAQNAPPKEVFTFLQSAVTAELRVRDFAQAEKYAQQMVKLAPQFFGMHDTLSVCLGKEGKYDDAIAEAKHAIELDKGAGMHENLILACWEVLSGKKDDAAKRVAGIAVPTDEAGQRTYYSTISTYYAATGDEAKLQEAIGKALELDKQGSFKDVLERDVAFDAYRDKEWFIKIAGKTLAE